MTFCATLDAMELIADRAESAIRRWDWIGSCYITRSTLLNGSRPISAFCASPAVAGCGRLAAQDGVFCCCGEAARISRRLSADPVGQVESARLSGVLFVRTRRVEFAAD